MRLHGTRHVSKLLELGMGLGDLIWKTIQHVLKVDVRRVAGFYILPESPTNFGVVGLLLFPSALETVGHGNPSGGRVGNVVVPGC